MKKEVVLFSKTGNNKTIERIISTIKKYRFRLLKDFDAEPIVFTNFISNGHKKIRPIINWKPKDEAIIITAEEKFLADIYDLFSVTDQDRPMIYTKMEMEAFADCDLADIEVDVVPKLNGKDFTLFYYYGKEIKI